MRKFVQSLSLEAEATGHHRTSRAHRTALGRVLEFAKDDTVSLRTVFALKFLLDFQNHLIKDKLRMSTVSFYMNRLRAIYSAAVKAGKLQAKPNLFSHTFTGRVETEKRSLLTNTISGIHAANLSDHPRLEYCRDLFMASLYLQGMPFVDLVNLRECDWKGRLLTYIRQKTKSPIGVYVLDAAEEYLLRLIAKGETDALHLLPIITLEGKEGYTQYESALHLQNKRLKDLAAHLGITENLTTYKARHSWATVASKSKIRITTISKALGHKTEVMTQIYIGNIDQEEIRDANQAVLDAVMKPILNGEVTNVREEVRRSMEEQKPEPIINACQETTQPAEEPVEQQPAQQAPIVQVSEDQQNREEPVCNNVETKAAALNPVNPQKKKHLSHAQRKLLNEKKIKEEAKQIKQTKTKILRHSVHDGG